jgi:sulfur carrier protein ThiS
MANLIINGKSFEIEKVENLKKFLEEKGFLRSKWDVVLVDSQPLSLEELENFKIDTNKDVKIEIANIVGGG